MTPRGGYHFAPQEPPPATPVPRAEQVRQAIEHALRRQDMSELKSALREGEALGLRPYQLQGARKALERQRQEDLDREPERDDAEMQASSRGSSSTLGDPNSPNASSSSAGPPEAKAVAETRIPLEVSLKLTLSARHAHLSEAPEQLSRARSRSSSLGVGGDANSDRKMQLRKESALRMLQLAIDSRDAHALTAALREGEAAGLERAVLVRASCVLDEWVRMEWQKVDFMKRVASAVSGEQCELSSEELEQLCVEAERYHEVGLRKDHHSVHFG